MDEVKILKEYNNKLKYNLICGDALYVLPSVANVSVDHCITDPPYNISGYDNKKKIGWLVSNGYWKEQKKFNKIDEKWDSFSNGKYEEFTTLWLKEIFRVVKPNGNIIIFCSYHNMPKITTILEKEDKKILNIITWYKRNAFPNITHRMLCDSTEFVIWAINNSQKDAKNWIFNYEILKKMNPVKKCNKCKKTVSGEYKFCPFCGNGILQSTNLQLRNMWDIPGTPITERKYGKHPSQKPIEVVKRLILGATKENELILDPFTGSGTIPLVAKDNRRKFIAIDSEKNYCELTLKRLNHPEQLSME